MEEPTPAWINGEDTSQVNPKLLVRWMLDAHLYIPKQEWGQKVMLKTRCKEQLTEHVCALPNIVSDTREYTTHTCRHCGQGFRVEDYFLMLQHGRNTCANKFVDRKCVCGREFESYEQAWKHCCVADCKNREFRMEQARKKEEEKEKKKRERQQVYNENRKSVSRCDVCDVDFLTKRQEENHMKGKHHLYKVDPSKRPNLRCDLCDSTFLSRKQMETHNQTRKHLNRLPHSNSHTPSQSTHECVLAQPSCPVSPQ
jgi:hypothetical protein